MPANGKLGLSESVLGWRCPDVRHRERYEGREAGNETDGRSKDISGDCGFPAGWSRGCFRLGKQCTLLFILVMPYTSLQQPCCSRIQVWKLGFRQPWRLPPLAATTGRLLPPLWSFFLQYIIQGPCMLGIIGGCLSKSYQELKTVDFSNHRIVPYVVVALKPPRDRHETRPQSHHHPP